VIDAITCPLKSGKEADVFVVERDEACYIAKVFREREMRSFKNDAGYKEGRKSRNTRSQRAMDKNSKYGKELAESAWHSAEADALTQLGDAGVRVPELYDHYDRVLFMEMICDPDGEPAPQLGNVPFTPEEALVVYEQVVGEVIRMLLAGFIHADLSPYNILIDDNGPVIIDFPQCVSAAHNLQASAILQRDIHSISRHLGLINPEIIPLGKQAWQIWEEYEAGSLKPDFRPVLGRVRKMVTPEMPDLVGFLRATEREVELSRLAAEGDHEAREELRTHDIHAEMRAKGIEPIIEPESEDDESQRFLDMDLYEDPDESGGKTSARKSLAELNADDYEAETSFDASELESKQGSGDDYRNQRDLGNRRSPVRSDAEKVAPVDKQESDEESKGNTTPRRTRSRREGGRREIRRRDGSRRRDRGRRDGAPQDRPRRDSPAKDENPRETLKVEASTPVENSPKESRSTEELAETPRTSRNDRNRSGRDRGWRTDEDRTRDENRSRAGNRRSEGKRRRDEPRQRDETPGVSDVRRREEDRSSENPRAQERGNRPARERSPRRRDEARRDRSPQTASEASNDEQRPVRGSESSENQRQDRNEQPTPRRESSQRGGGGESEPLVPNFGSGRSARGNANSHLPNFGNVSRGDDENTDTRSSENRDDRGSSRGSSGNRDDQSGERRDSSNRQSRNGRPSRRRRG
jgi:RIO kinase 1